MAGGALAFGASARLAKGGRKKGGVVLSESVGDESMTQTTLVAHGHDVTALEVVGYDGKHLGSMKKAKKEGVLTVDKKIGVVGQVEDSNGNRDLWSQCDGGGGGGKRWETPGKFEKSEKRGGFDCG